MDKNSKKIDFDLSKNSLTELIELFQKIEEFIKFLENKKISSEEKVEE